MRKGMAACVALYWSRSSATGRNHKISFTTQDTKSTKSTKDFRGQLITLRARVLSRALKRLRAAPR
jgi:hypothetical protein